MKRGKKGRGDPPKLLAKRRAKRRIPRTAGSHWGPSGDPKVTFLTLEAAVARAEHLNALYRTDRHHAYKCSTCPGWHLSRGHDARRISG